MCAVDGGNLRCNEAECFLSAVMTSRQRSDDFLFAESRLQTFGGRISSGHLGKAHMDIVRRVCYSVLCFFSYSADSMEMYSMPRFAQKICVLQIGFELDVCMLEYGTISQMRPQDDLADAGVRV